MKRRTIQPEMVLRNGFLQLAHKLQESADSLSAKDVQARLSDAVNDAHRGTGGWAYYVDHIGDETSGDCIYYCSGDMRMAAYEISQVGGKSTVTIDTENSLNVVPRTTYEVEADEDDHYAGMEESFKSAKLYVDLPLYERFISKKDRASATEDDFAGKGKSYPILKPEDVKAAVHAMGRAGEGNYGVGKLKANIIAIAKRKGWTKYLPKTWQADTAQEGAAPKLAAGTLRVMESACTLDPIRLVEARSDYEIKLIAPGKGSSAFYPAEVLKRDGPGVFKAGTHVYLNHPTAAEEAARPEGDVKNLAGVLTADAVYHEAHAKGPGLYGRMKVFADHAQTVEEKAPHVGMSIRAEGVAESGRKAEGLPILKQLLRAESVDVVTHAGAGGMILTEGARPAQQEHNEMDEATAKKLIEAAVAPVLARALKGDARELATELLESSTFPQEAQREIITRCLAVTLPVKEGQLDAEAFRAIVVQESQSVGRLLSSVTGNGRVFGMGSASTTAAPSAESLALEEANRKRDEADLTRLQESEEDVFLRLTGGNKDAAKAAARGRAA